MAEYQAERLPQETRSQDEGNRQRGERPDGPKGREAVYPRHYHEVEQHGRDVQCPVRQPLPKNRSERRTRLPGQRAAPLKCDAAQHRRAHQQCLMQDQYESGRHDIARV